MCCMDNKESENRYGHDVNSFPIKEEKATFCVDDQDSKLTASSSSSPILYPVITSVFSLTTKTEKGMFQQEKMLAKSKPSDIMEERGSINKDHTQDALTHTKVPPDLSQNLEVLQKKVTKPQGTSFEGNVTADTMVDSINKDQTQDALTEVKVPPDPPQNLKVLQKELTKPQATSSEGNVTAAEMADVTNAMSFSIKDKGVASCMDPQHSEVIGAINNPTGVGTMKRKRKTGCPKKYTSTKTHHKSAPGNEKGSVPHIPELDAYTSSPMVEAELETKGKKSNEPENCRSNSTHVNLKEDSVMAKTSEKYKYSQSNQTKALLSALQSSTEKRCEIHRCSECDKTFSLKNNLIKHMKVHARQKMYQNSESEESLSLKKNLRAHQRPNKEEKERQYQCTECEKSFNHYSILQAHRRTHSVEKPYQCTECEKSFNHHSSLAVHKRTHAGERLRLY